MARPLYQPLFSKTQLRGRLWPIGGLSTLMVMAICMALASPLLAQEMDPEIPEKKEAPRKAVQSPVLKTPDQQTGELPQAEAKKQSPDIQNTGPSTPATFVGTAYVDMLYSRNKEMGLFDYFEIRSDSLKGFKKWSGMIERTALPDDQVIRNASVRSKINLGPSRIRLPSNYDPNPKDLKKKTDPSDQARPKQGQDAAKTKCSRFNRVQCRKDQWETLISTLQKRRADGATDKDILEAVNLYMNETPYIVDPTNWGVPDYWATTTEFFYKDGDCEDYAISKYVTLSRIGLPKEAMRLVIGQDNNSRVEHAVLSVFLGTEEYILDNQVNEVLPQSRIKHFSPVYAINEKAWWRFTKRLFT